jgi:hypothetical protein
MRMRMGVGVGVGRRTAVRFAEHVFAAGFRGGGDVGVELPHVGGDVPVAHEAGDAAAGVVVVGVGRDVGFCGGIEPRDQLGGAPGRGRGIRLPGLDDVVCAEGGADLFDPGVL